MTEPVIPAEPVRVTVPVYSPGIHVEISQDRDRFTAETVVDVTFSAARQLRITDELRVRGGDAAVQDAVHVAVRQIQDEAVSALGLNTWKRDIQNEAARAEKNARYDRLVKLLEAARSAPNEHAIRLLIADAIMEVAR